MINGWPHLAEAVHCVFYPWHRMGIQWFNWDMTSGQFQTMHKKHQRRNLFVEIFFIEND